MPIWDDPLDELIADLERSVPPAPAVEFDMRQMGDFSGLVMSVLSPDPAERERLAADPAVKRAMASVERMGRHLRSKTVEPPPE